MMHPNQSGASLISYALLVVLISLVVIVAVVQLQDPIGEANCDVAITLDIKSANDTFDPLETTTWDSKLKCCRNVNVSGVCQIFPEIPPCSRRCAICADTPC